VGSAGDQHWKTPMEKPQVIFFGTAVTEAEQKETSLIICI